MAASLSVLNRRVRPVDTVALCVVLDSSKVQDSPYSVEQYVRMRLEPEIRSVVERLENALCQNQGLR